MEERIYKLSDEDYASLASEIKGHLMSPCYFTGVVESLACSGEILRLTASLILYRRRANSYDPYGPGDAICNLSAVWWDFVCEGEEGVVADDFDFERFSKFLIEE